MLEFKMTERVKSLREAYLNSEFVKNRLDYNRARRMKLYYRRGFAQHRGVETVILRRALADAYLLDRMEPVIVDGELIVGQSDFSPLTEAEAEELIWGERLEVKDLVVHFLGDLLVEEAIIGSDRLDVLWIFSDKNAVIHTVSTVGVERQLGAPNGLCVGHRAIIQLDPLGKGGIPDVAADVAVVIGRVVPLVGAEPFLPGNIVGDDVVVFVKMHLLDELLGQLLAVALERVGTAEGKVNIDAQLLARRDQMQHIVGFQRLLMDEDRNGVHTDVLDAQKIVGNDVGIVGR